MDVGIETIREIVDEISNGKFIDFVLIQKQKTKHPTIVKKELTPVIKENVPGGLKYPLAPEKPAPSLLKPTPLFTQADCGL